jgi:hypothetical protein
MSHKCGSVAVLLGLILTAALYGQKKADFSRFVVAGDSLSAGYQNSQLIESGQVHGYANVIATQAGVSLKLPLLPPPGYPQISIEQNYAVVTGLTPVARLNRQQTLDVAVPGFSVADLVGLRPSCNPDPTNPIAVMAAEILKPNCSTNPGTELQVAAALRPTTAILWIGSNDALFSLLFNNTDPTDVSTFSGYYHSAATTMAGASEHLVMANIPDVTLTAYLTSVPKLAAILGRSGPEVEAEFGLGSDDMVTPYAFPFIQAMQAAGSFAPLPDSVPQGPIVIRTTRLAQIRAAVIGYNDVIASEAAANGATLVDIYSLINDLAAHGAKVGGQTLTTDFAGGLFSLDGVHPTNTGYAIIANEFIKTMNAPPLLAHIPYVDVEQVTKTDPLIFSENDHGKHTGHVSVGMADGLRVLGRR